MRVLATQPATFLGGMAAEKVSVASGGDRLTYLGKYFFSGSQGLFYVFVGMGG